MIPKNTTVWTFRRFAASLMLGACVCNLLIIAPISLAASSVRPAQNQLADDLQELYPPAESVPDQLLAHHEGAAAANQLLTTGATAVGTPASKSLWGTMILSMAIQQDAQIQQIGKKLGRMSGFVFSSVGAISALSLVQGIDGLVTLQDDPHPYHPPVLGLIGSGLSLLSVGAQAAMGHHYKKQLLAREEMLAHQVEHILAHLKADGVTDDVTSELAKLIGMEATQEFIGLWSAAHPAK